MDPRSPGRRDAEPVFDPATTPVPRRRMLVLMGASALAAGGLGVILEACSSSPSVTVTLAVSPATLPPGTPVEVPFTLTTSGGGSVSGSTWLVRRADGSVTAFDPRCTHAACRYKWAADASRFKCNCHGGEFALDGTVLAGPPPRPLRAFPLHQAGDILTVDVPGDFQTPKESLST